MLGSSVSSPVPPVHLRAQSLRLSLQSSLGSREGMRSRGSHESQPGGGRDRVTLSPASESPHGLPTLLGSSQVALLGPHREAPASSGGLRQLGNPSPGVGHAGEPPFPVLRLGLRFGSNSVSLHKSGHTLMCGFIRPKPKPNRQGQGIGILGLIPHSVPRDIRGRTLSLPYLHPGAR